MRTKRDREMRSMRKNRRRSRRVIARNVFRTFPAIRSNQFPTFFSKLRKSLATFNGHPRGKKMHALRRLRETAKFPTRHAAAISARVPIPRVTKKKKKKKRARRDKWTSDARISETARRTASLPSHNRVSFARRRAFSWSASPDSPV